MAQARNEGEIAGRLVKVHSACDLVGQKIQTHPEKKKIADSVAVMDKETAIKVLLEGKMCDELLENWQIIKVLGHGAFGTVFHVQNYHTHESAALKVIQRAKVTDKSALTNEIAALRRCSHPSITRLIAHYSDNHAEYLLLEECTGGDLLEYLMGKGAMAVTDISFLFQQVLQGLAYIHDHDIIHRDMKLENLLLVDNDDISKGLRIADFGIVHMFPLHKTAEDRQKEIVKGTEYAGSVQYMAPEIVHETDYTSKVDLWSAGVVLYTMAFLNFPFGGTSDEECLKLLKTTKGVDLSDPFFEDKDKDLLDLIKNLLEVNPQDRFGTEEALAHPFLTKFNHKTEHSMPHFTPGVALSDEILPPGWTSRKADNGRIYFVHEEHGHEVSTWVSPAEHLLETEKHDTLVDALDVGTSLRRTKYFDESLAAISAIVTPENAVEELLSTTMAPEVVSQWRVIKPLGHGAYGTVVLVQSRKTKEKAALKLINLNKVTDTDELETEIEALRRCHHRCVTGILQSYRDAKFQYLAMEACPGGDLLDYLMDGFAPMNTSDAAFAFSELIHGVSYLHGRGILHRDLKPDNILLVEKGNIRAGLRICDFGLVHLFPIHADVLKNASQLSLQQQKDVVDDGSLAGTYLYLAPEVILGAVYSFPVDLWSCGIILHAMVLAFFPFDNEDDGLLCALIASCIKPSFSEHRFKSVDKDLLDLIAQLLDPEPEARITSHGVLKHSFMQAYQPSALL